MIIGCGMFGGIGKTPALIGKGMNEADSFATLDEALALGLTMLDTAERYAAGASERIIGAWLRKRNYPEGLILTTKVAPPVADGIPAAPFDHTYIERKLGESLERLGLARVDWYLAHEMDDTTPIEITLEGFTAMVEDGKVGKLGCCNVNLEQLTRALDAAERLGVPGYACVQNGFNLMMPDQDRELRTLCRERGVAYTAFSPLAGGLLTGKYRRGEPYPPGTRMALRPEGYDSNLTDAMFEALDRLRAAAAEKGVSCGALALAWLLAHPDCAAPVAGPARIVPHLGHISEALTVSLSPEEHDQIGAWFRATCP